MTPWQLAVSAERWRQRLVRGIGARLGGNGTVYVAERSDEYRRYWEEGARLVGAEFTPLTSRIWEVRRGDRRVRLANHVTPCDDPATRQLAGDKPFCLALAKAAGVPVPAHVVVTLTDLEPARHFLAAQRGPVVVKPARDSSSGLGVTTHVNTWPGVIRAAALASFYDQSILVERMIAGESCRLLFLDGRLIHAVRRRGVRVTGDGRSTIAQLIARVSPGLGPSDWNLVMTLGAANRRLDEVPREGEEVLVRSLPPATAETRELRTVYDETVTAACAPELVAELSGVLRRLGSEFAGIDLIANDLGRPLGASGGTFLEINTTPGIHHHYITPEDFAPTPVAKLVLEYLLGNRRGQGATHGLV